MADRLLQEFEKNAIFLSKLFKKCLKPPLWPVFLFACGAEILVEIKSL